MDIHAKETVFHDQWAAAVAASEVHVRECFEAPAAMENQFIIRHMGPLWGKQILDIGSGLGESSVYFAQRGAVVTMIDISPQMIAKAQEVGRHNGLELQGYATVGEQLPVPDGAFDFVYVANTIHHVADRRRLMTEIRRVLKSGGRFYSIDPVAYNPAINIYRRMATQVRTEDETPVSRADVALAREYFHRVGFQTFWIASLALFAKYFLIDRIHPNQDRYWKRILLETPRSLWWWWPLRWFDMILTRIPGLRWWAWNLVLWGERA